MQIKQQKNEGYKKMNEYIMRKREQARKDVDGQAEDYKQQIINLENEGDQLEKLETELLRKL